MEMYEVTCGVLPGANDLNTAIRRPKYALQVLDWVWIALNSKRKNVYFFLDYREMHGIHRQDAHILAHSNVVRKK